MSKEIYPLTLIERDSGKVIYEMPVNYKVLDQSQEYYRNEAHKAAISYLQAHPSATLILNAMIDRYYVTDALRCDSQGKLYEED